MAEAGVPEPHGIDEGPDGARDDRGGRTRRTNLGRRHRCRVHGGSSGPALALVCAAKGYRALIVIADCFTEERFQLMRALGAELDIVRSVEGRPKVTSQDIDNMVARERGRRSPPRRAARARRGDRDASRRHRVQVHERQPVRRDIASVQRNRPHQNVHGQRGRPSPVRRVTLGLYEERVRARAVRFDHLSLRPASLAGRCLSRR